MCSILWMTYDITVYSTDVEYGKVSAGGKQLSPNWYPNYQKVVYRLHPLETFNHMVTDVSMHRKTLSTGKDLSKDNNMASSAKVPCASPGFKMMKNSKLPSLDSVVVQEFPYEGPLHISNSFHPEVPNSILVNNVAIAEQLPSFNDTTRESTSQISDSRILQEVREIKKHRLLYYICLLC
jgi:hypothetical protein